MKKFFTIFSIFLLGAVACTKSSFEDPKPAGEESGIVEVTMSLQVPPEIIMATKAGEMSHLPNIEDIRVAMFGISGYCQAYTKAEPDGSYANHNYDPANPTGTTFKFKVLLPVYEGEVHIHIIANGDKSVIYDGWPENKLMTKMATEAGIGAFWARIVIPDGILPQWSTNGTMEVKDGNFIPTEATAAYFQDITLIRNFAEVKLVLDNITKLTDVTYTVVNVPVNGSVAPIFGDSVYSEPKSATDTTTLYYATYLDDFDAYRYNPATGKMSKGTTIYDGYMLTQTLKTSANVAADKALESVPSLITGNGENQTQTAGTPAFVYERLLPTENPPMILMRGKWTDNKYYYYRLDMMDETLTNTSGYFPLYRNYQYQIRIAKIGNKGAATIAEAMTRNSGGNISMTMDTRSLKDISDGTSQLKVAYTDHTYITGGDKSDFYVEYQAVAGSSSAVEGASVDVYFKKDANGNPIKGTAITSDITVDHTTDGKTYYKFTLADRGSETLESTFVVEAKNGKTGDDASKLVREITVRVLKTLELDPSFNPAQAAYHKGSSVVLNIALSDTLMQSMFPLEFHIEDTNHILNPTGKNGAGQSIDVPVLVENSLADGSKSFSFIRTINWTEYDPMRRAFKNGDHSAIVFTTEFKTLEAATETEVWIYNEYFQKAHRTLERAEGQLTTKEASFDYTNFATDRLSAQSEDELVQVSFNRIRSISNGYIQMSNQNETGTMTITANQDGILITEVSMEFTDYDHSSGTITANPGIVSAAVNATPCIRTWNANGTASSNNVVLTFTRGGGPGNRLYHQIKSITVKYQYYE